MDQPSVSLEQVLAWEPCILGGDDPAGGHTPGLDRIKAGFAGRERVTASDILASDVFDIYEKIWAVTFQDLMSRELGERLVHDLFDFVVLSRWNPVDWPIINEVAAMLKRFAAGADREDLREEVLALRDRTYSPSIPHLLRQRLLDALWLTLPDGSTIRGVDSSASALAEAAASMDQDWTLDILRRAFGGPSGA
jgi:hypothetical protein